MEKFIFKTSPYQHQRESFDSSANRENFALLMDMGTGKTKVCLDTIGYNFEQKKIQLVIIVAPKGVIANWLGEIETHLPDRIEREIVLWKPNLTKTKRQELKELYEKSGKLKFLLMNVEAYSTKKGVDVAEFFVKKFKVFMAVDESTTIKNRQAKRTKAICAVGRGAVMRRILTGSPVTKSPWIFLVRWIFSAPKSLASKATTLFKVATPSYSDVPWDPTALTMWLDLGGWTN